MYHKDNITIRKINKFDLNNMWLNMYNDRNMDWAKWDSPYLNHQYVNQEDFLENGVRWVDSEYIWLIVVDGDIYGFLTYRDIEKSSNLIEIGILIFQSDSWGKGIGTQALKMWINHLFKTLSLHRIGLSTWSGNYRMIKLSEKLKMQKEAHVRKAFIINGQFYDSLSYGLLREEWEENYNIT